MNNYNIARIDKIRNMDGKAFLYFIYNTLGGSEPEVFTRQFHIYSEAQNFAGDMGYKTAVLMEKAHRTIQYLMSVEPNMKTDAFSNGLQLITSKWVSGRTELLMGDRDVLLCYDDRLKSSNTYISMIEFLSLLNNDNVGIIERIESLKEILRKYIGTGMTWTKLLKEKHLTEMLIDSIITGFNHPEVAQRFVRHIYGSNDYYAVCDNTRDETHLTAYNLYGTLNGGAYKEPAIIDVLTDRQSETDFCLSYGDWVFFCKAATSGQYVTETSLILRCRAVKIPDSFTRLFLNDIPFDSDHGF